LSGQGIAGGVVPVIGGLVMAVATKKERKNDVMNEKIIK